MPLEMAGNLGALAGLADGLDCVAVYRQPHVEKSTVVMVFISSRKAGNRAAMQARCDAVRKSHEAFLRENTPQGRARHTSSRYDEARKMFSLHTEAGQFEMDRFLFFTGQSEVHVVALGPNNPFMSRVRQHIRAMRFDRGKNSGSLLPFDIPELPFKLPGGVWPWLLLVGLIVFFWVGRR